MVISNSKKQLIKSPYAIASNPMSESIHSNSNFNILLGNFEISPSRLSEHKFK